MALSTKAQNLPEFRRLNAVFMQLRAMLEVDSNLTAPTVVLYPQNS